MRMISTLLMDILVLSIGREGDPVHALHYGFGSQDSF